MPFKRCDRFRHLVGKSANQRWMDAFEAFNTLCILTLYESGSLLAKERRQHKVDHFSKVECERPILRASVDEYAEFFRFFTTALLFYVNRQHCTTKTLSKAHCKNTKEIFMTFAFLHAHYRYHYTICGFLDNA